MVKRGTEILPKGRMRPGVVRRKQQGQHIDESADASWTGENAENERETDTQLSISHDKRYRSGVMQHQSLQHGNHKWVGTFHKKPVDPKLEATPPDELRPKNLVVAKNQKEYSHGDSQCREGYRVLVSHVDSHSKCKLWKRLSPSVPANRDQTYLSRASSIRQRVKYSIPHPLQRLAYRCLVRFVPDMHNGRQLREKDIGRLTRKDEVPAAIARGDPAIQGN
jgi:hypothetical protein